MLQINNITFRYGRTEIISDISFRVSRGEIVAVLGQNGSGKSTLLRCLNRILRSHTGYITLDDERLDTFSAERIARHIAYVPQRLETAPLSVFDAVLLGRKPYFVWQPSQTDFEIVAKMLYRFGLNTLAHRPLHQLSGGEVQKTALARAMVQEPKLLLLDEPTSALDLKNQVELLRILREIVEERNIMAILSMHDVNIAVRHADRFLLLKQGKLIGDAGRNKLTSEMLETVYDLPIEIHTSAQKVSFIIEKV
ncbi:ABC transporter ATP-binding protein [Planctomycetales bacterium]|nr:ABC transporter ATP-binding protein [Planctomycetales bacterium]